MTATDKPMIVVLHSSRAPETRVYRLNVAHISHWAGNTFPAGSVVWMAGIADPLLVHETPAEIDRLVLSDEWAAMMLTDEGRAVLRAPSPFAGSWEPRS